MRIRPRLLVGSLLVAVAVIAAFAWYSWAQRSGDDAVDATLNDPQTVITYPNNGLGNEAVAGEPLPDVPVLDAADDAVTTGEMTGTPLVINLWYSTCAPCATELPEFAEVDAETDAVRFIGVNPRDSIDVMERFAGDRGVEYDLYRDDQFQLTDELGIVAFPVTLFVTSGGTIVEQTGALDADELRSKIDNLLLLDEGAT